MDYVVGFDDMGGKDDFTTEMLATRLGAVGIINYEPGDVVAARKPAPQRSVRQGGCQDEDEDSDFD